jgi:hypothetical protein
VHKSSRRRVADVAPMQGTQKRCSGVKWALMWADLTTARATGVFPIPPGPRITSL